jgi:hypothetical protein
MHQLNRSEEREIVAAVIGDEFADAAARVIDYLNSNVEPDRVFDDDVLQEWVGENYAVGDVFSDDLIRTYATARWHPEEVFDESELDTWAIENGYVKAE